MLLASSPLAEGKKKKNEIHREINRVSKLEYFPKTLTTLVNCKIVLDVPNLVSENRKTQKSWHTGRGDYKTSPPISRVEEI